MNEIVLRGLDGANPLAFLAALGTLRLLSPAASDVRLHWAMDGAWRPVLTGSGASDEDALCRRLLEIPPIPEDLVSQLGKNLTVSESAFAAFVSKAEEKLLETGDRTGTDFAASFGSEVCVDEKKGRIEYTDLCFITGSGHQNFVETARNLAKKTEAKHVHEALFGPWERQDKGLSMRWDPEDAAEYALQWDNPGPLGVYSVWGANRLAVEALPLFSAQPTSKGLATTGFDKDEFCWPIWGSPTGCDTVRSLLALSELRSSSGRAGLAARGIREVYRARRVRIGQGANFKVSFRPARAV